MEVSYLGGLEFKRSYFETGRIIKSKDLSLAYYLKLLGWGRDRCLHCFRKDLNPFLRSMFTNGFEPVNSISIKYDASSV